MSKEFKKLENFIYACGAARIILRRAHDEGFLIEGIVLYASLIDAFLRIAIVLKRQIRFRSSNIDYSLISQDTEERKHYSEREIFKMALKEKIINEELYNELNLLYNKRNSIIHKFFLTNIKYSDLPKDLIHYETIYHMLWKIVYNLENEQIEKGVGMTTGDDGETDESSIRKKASEKII